MGVQWATFESAAPDLARMVQGRFEAHIHHVLGTVRLDGSPRLSGTELHVVDGELTLGMMNASFKQWDIERDPRVEVHSNPDGHDMADGDARVAGMLEATGPVVDESDPDADGPVGTMYRMLIDRVVLIRVRDDALEVASWTPDRGESVEYRR